jgi:hypothetical protein
LEVSDLKMILNKVLNEIKRGQDLSPESVAISLYPEIFLVPQVDYMASFLKTMLEVNNENPEEELHSVVGVVG